MEKPWKIIIRAMLFGRGRGGGFGCNGWGVVGRGRRRGSWVRENQFKPICGAQTKYIYIYMCKHSFWVLWNCKSASSFDPHFCLSIRRIPFSDTYSCIYLYTIDSETFVQLIFATFFNNDWISLNVMRCRRKTKRIINGIFFSWLN